MRVTNQQRAFTLVELMVTVAIIGVMSTAAVMLTPDKYHKGAKGFAEQVAGLLATARERAIVTGRIQQIEFTPVRIRHWQSNSPGFGYSTSTTFSALNSLNVPSSINVYGIDMGTLRINAGQMNTLDGKSGGGNGSESAPPAPDANGIPPGNVIQFRPDGSAHNCATVLFFESATGDSNAGEKSRLLVYRFAGNAIVLDGWGSI